MAVKAHKLGPGSLKFGETGSEVEFAVALKECAVEPEFKDDEPDYVLSGDSYSGDDAETAKLTGKLLQSYDKESLLVWAHVNNRTEVPFVFRPDNDKDLTVTGTVTVRRLTIGGKVKERNESDFEWPIKDGTYDLVDATTKEKMTWTTQGETTVMTDETPAWD